jgi:hypothetical protein
VPGPAEHDASIGAPAAGLPGEVCKVLQDNGCITCHQTPTQAGAPMGLQWRSDLMGKARDGSPLATTLLARVQDTRAPMPPPTSMRPRMPADQVAVLRGWFDAGMPGASTGACQDKAPAPTAGASWADQPWPDGECEYVFTIGAHGESGTPRASDASPYLTQAGETEYHCFYEKVPWGDAKVQALAVRARLEGPDDRAVLHHTVLSALAPGSEMSLLGGERPTRGGVHYECENQSGSTVAMWAPGTRETATFPKDVGVLLPSGNDAYLELQVHYNNAQSGQKSRFAFDVCATSKLRAQTAAVHWLGFENATFAITLAPLGPELQPALDNRGNGVAVGTCRAKQRTRVLWLLPHMHQRGRHAKVEILRANGCVQTAHDAPFDFNEQTAYLQNELWVEQGESIRTTCSWDPGHKIVFGLSSHEEMCFVYALSYPVGALAGVGDELGVVGGDLNCAGSE